MDWWCMGGAWVCHPQGCLHVTKTEDRSLFCFEGCHGLIHQGASRLAGGHPRCAVERERTWSIYSIYCHWLESMALTKGRPFLMHGVLVAWPERLPPPCKQPSLFQSS